MTGDLSADEHGRGGDAHERGRSADERALMWVLLAAVPLVVAYYTVQMRALVGDALRDDLGIQFHLARATAEGAVPLIDFEHGWNAGSWYLSALLYRLAGGEPTVWTFLWGRATGFVLAGLLVLAIAWRLRLSAWWAAVLVPAWMLVTHVPNGKYTTPLLWLLVLLPVGAARRLPRAVALRVALAAVTWWFHVELAILLGVGVGLYDLFGARGVDLRARLLRAAAPAAGLALGLGSQTAVYTALGLAPADLLGQLLFGHGETTAANFGYPLGAPPTFRTLVYPASLVLPFVPVVWRRLTSPTRLVAFLHLSQALIAIRRTDDNHIAAAATLLAVLAVLAARDLLRARASVVDRDGARWQRVGGLALGAGWAALAIAAGFRVESRLAIVLLTLTCLAAVAASHTSDRWWPSLGAFAAVVALLAGGLGGHVVAQVRDSDPDVRGEAIAEALAADVDACLGPDRLAWVVPGPLSLYDRLELVNPTPFVVFWYTFEHEADRVESLLEDGEIPAVVQVGPWPPSMTGMARALEETLRPCATVDVAATGDRVTVWTSR